jgi:hypothetical protein
MWYPRATIDRSRFSIIPIDTAHWLGAQDRGVIRRTNPSLIPLASNVDAIMAGAISFVAVGV